jgi:hypothetical protein
MEGKAENCKAERRVRFPAAQLLPNFQRFSVSVFQRLFQTGDLAAP